MINELGQGAILGELGLLTGAARSASVRARRDAQLLRLPKDQFDTITMASPSVLRTVAATVAGLVQTIAPRGPHVPREIAEDDRRWRCLRTPQSGTGSSAGCSPNGSSGRATGMSRPRSPAGPRATWCGT
ncbi:MAG: cyclic nucleotide-binding domain-containing protein [Actinomycetota bacterium]|nr:cyclic nucleotide-binding domain-containing protein [Actinomycetota bacterium]